jgi:acyl transferase domain-containing protein
MAAGRLSFTLGCGTEYVDTACSSSLVAVHLAYQRLAGRITSRWPPA